MPRWLGLAPAHSRNCRAEWLSQSILETSAPLSMAVEKGAKTAVVWLLFTLPLSLLEGVFSQNGPQRSRARRCCAAKRTLHGEDRSEILDKRERGGPKWTAKMAQSLTASDMPGARHERIATSASVKGRPENRIIGRKHRHRQIK